jgi:hypothetical protein
LLAVVHGEAGRTELAAQLAGYADAHQSHGWMSNLHDRWLNPRLGNVLSTLPEQVRDREVRAGASLSRRELLNLGSRTSNARGWWC